jgi:mono/diheme cytochrome c family protein
LPAALVILAPVILLGWTLTAVVAQTSPSPAASPSGSPAAGAAAPAGDPQRGQQLFSSSGCTSCHGASLEGGVGPRLNPIVHLPDTKDPLTPSYLIDTITNGKSGVGGYGTMPPKGGNQSLTEKDISDIAAYIIQVNQQKGPTALGPVELARSDVFWVTVGIVIMVLLTWLLSRYNMRWVERRAAARREREQR